MNAKLSIKGLGKAKRFIMKFPKEKQDAARLLLTQFGYKILAEGKRDAPVGISGDLRSRTHFELNETGGVLEGILGFVKLFYAPYIHGVNVGGKWLGPKRHFVPFAIAPSLERWAQLKGINTGGWKAKWGEKWAEKSGKDISKMRGMWVGGVDKANPFLYRAAMANNAAIHKAFRKLSEVDIDG